jgi:hypothetical protein
MRLGHVDLGHKSRGNRETLYIFGSFAAFAFLVVTAIIIFATKSSESACLASTAMPTQLATMNSRTGVDCGDSPDTARARGCHFDFVSFVWLPHECYDDAYVNSFAAKKDWTWHYDVNNTAGPEIPLEVLRTGDVAMGWVSWEYHRAHCAWTWMKLVSDVEKAGAIDGYVLNMNHTRHCAKLMMQEGVDAEEVNSKFFVQYPTCWV